MKIADRWFRFRKIDDEVTLIWEPYADPFARCNIWHIKGRDRDLLIDTGLGIASLREAASSIFDKRLTAVATHTHFDHTGGMHEFDERIVHEIEAPDMADPSESMVLSVSGFNPDVIAAIRESGYTLESDSLLSALPYEGFQPDQHRNLPAAPTSTVVDGDVIDLGNRSFEVLHLPGHSPGSIGLWERRTGILFSGDAIYDGPLLACFPGADIDHYIETLIRLRDIPVRVVHGGHDASFGRERLLQIIDRYLNEWNGV